MRTVLYFLGAIGLAVTAAVLVRTHLSNTPQPAVAQKTEQAEPGAQPATTSVLVATKQLTPGRLLQTDDLQWQPWPAETVPPSGFRRDDTTRSAVTGAVTRESIAKGQPVLPAQLVRPGERGFLAAVLAPGTRAVSVDARGAGGVAGLIYPGDRVDLLLTFRQPGGDGENSWDGEQQAVRTVMRGLRVVAVGQRLAPAGPGDAPGLAPGPITLEATPAQAREIALANDLGGISLALHSLRLSRGGSLGASAADTASAMEIFGARSPRAASKRKEPSGGNRQRIRVIQGAAEKEVEVDVR